ncbi:VOC family protein, partial [Rhizobium phaseoli]
MPGISMRYIVDDVDAAVEFYTRHLGFSVALHPAPSFAILTRNGFRLLVSGTTGPGGASQAMPDGQKPEP